jgi:hypothetical protein
MAEKSPSRSAAAPPSGSPSSGGKGRSPDAAIFQGGGYISAIRTGSSRRLVDMDRSASRDERPATFDDASLGSLW